MKAIKLSVVVFVCMMAGVVLASEYSDGQGAGEAAIGEFSSQVQSGTKINERFAVPMTTDTPMKTFGPEDQQQEFLVKISAPSSKSFLTVFAQPGPNGDLQTLIARQDIDMDGNVDHVLTLPHIVSGVCSNGYISCDPGTWNNCRYYRWFVDDNLQLSSTQVPSIEHGLAACYCINSSCGSNLVWQNLSYVLSGLGGGMVGYLQHKDPHLAVSNVKTEATTISYYGQRTSEAGKGFSQVYFSGKENPEKYYRSGTIPVTEEVTSQAADPQSPYSQMVALQTNKVHPKESKHCMVQRKIAFAADSQPYVQINEDCSGIDTSACTIKTEQICNYDGAECVYSYRNGQGTGLTPLPSSVTLQAPNNLSWTFTADGTAISYQQGTSNGTLVFGQSTWWTVRREYLCDTGLQFNTADGDNRTSQVASSAAYSNGVLTYQDNGTSQTIQLPDGKSPGPCNKACKVEKPVKNTQVGQRGGTWEYQNNNDSVKIIIKTCIDETCPLEDGERLIKDCICMNEFAEAASIMQTLESASNDMICSQTIIQ